MDIQKSFQKLIEYFKGVKIESKKVNWLSKEETTRYTLIVIGVSAAVAAFLGGLDYLFTRILNIFLLR